MRGGGAFTDGYYGFDVYGLCAMTLSAMTLSLMDLGGIKLRLRELFRKTLGIMVGSNGNILCSWLGNILRRRIGFGRDLTKRGARTLLFMCMMGAKSRCNINALK
jgi:hypothetical protein